MPPPAPRRVLAGAAALIAAAGVSVALLAPAHAAGAPAGPDLAKASAYLVAPANLISGSYYEAFPGFADFGMTLDGAFSLAATGQNLPALRKIVDFLDRDAADASGNTVSSWTGIGTEFAGGGSIGKEALLAEVVGADPRHFTGADLIAALDATVCAAASTGDDFSCAAAGNYTYATSVFSQSLGIMAQMRAGDAANATRPIAYLESLQHGDGSFPSLIPDTGVSEVDSTAMAAMALALVPGTAASDAVDRAVAWIAGQQETDGGFPGAAGDSTNSAALAIQGLTLRAAGQQAAIAKAGTFLAARQNTDGGFDPSSDPGSQEGSDLRASTQAVSGATGVSFGVLHRDLSGVVTTTPTPRPTVTVTRTAHATTTRTATPPARTLTSVETATATATATATETATVAATPPPTETAPVTPSASRSTAVVAVADTSGLTGLWWLVLAVALLAILVVGLLWLRRRRLYPPNGRHKATS